MMMDPVLLAAALPGRHCACGSLAASECCVLKSALQSHCPWELCCQVWLLDVVLLGTELGGDVLVEVQEERHVVEGPHPLSLEE